MLFLIAYIPIGQEHFLLKKSLSPALHATFTKTHSQIDMAVLLLPPVCVFVY